jgi:hypothetical protein
MSNSQSDSRGAAPRQRAQKTAAPSPFVDVTEQKRLNEAREAGTPWKKWGPYLSERQWGTVREGLLQPRPVPRPGLPLGRGRHRWLLG